jgi:uncharacterized repeat protein (TIGR03803 family)
MIDLNRSRNLARLLPALIVSLNLILTERAPAQTFTTLHNFSAGDGTVPYGRLLLSSNVLFGTLSFGGSSGNGTVFKVNTDGTGFTNLHSFAALFGTNGIDTGFTGFGGTGTNSEGAVPNGSLILSGNTLYGTAFEGGSSGNGTVFSINTDGTGFTNLHNFTATSGSSGVFRFGSNSDGATPVGGLILSGNTLYGTAGYGGTLGYGSVFAVNTDGTGFTNLYSLNDDPDGADPYGTLILSGNTLYGTAANNGYNNGPSGNGTVFAVNTDGTNFRTLHHFSGGNDGATPGMDMVLSGNTLYGMAQGGGSSGNGTVFAVNTDGTGFSNLYSFSAGVKNGNGFNTNSDGLPAFTGPILSGNTVYGTANYGGSSGNGTLFALNANGTCFTPLHNFSAPDTNSFNSDGYLPAGLIISGNILYGTAAAGGSSGNGTLFSISFAPQLIITPSAAHVILTWPTNVAGFDYTGFTLQSTTNLISPAVWTNVSPASAVVNGQNTVTNPITGTQQFYRLSQ